MKYSIKFLYQKTTGLLFRLGNFLLIATPFFLLLLLLIAGFFQHPAVDDFGVFNLTTKYGLWGSIKFFFKSVDGRYFSMPVLFLITSSRFLLEHYYIVVAGLFLLTFSALFLFIKGAAGFFLIRLPVKWLLSAMLMLIFVSSVVQVSSLLYWWSSALTYLLPFDIFILYVLFFLKFISATTGSAKRTYFILLFIFSFFLCGSNEELAYFVVAGMGLYFLYQFLVFKVIDKKILWLLVAELIFALLLFFGPGSINRAGSYGTNTQPAFYSVTSAFYQSAEIFSIIFSSPFFWLGYLSSFLAYSWLRPDIRNRIAQKRNFFLEVFVLYITVIGFYFIARAFGGWVLHERANNAVILIVVTWLFVIAVRNGKAELSLILTLAKDRFASIIKFLLILFLLFNSFTQNTVKTIWAGYYHNIVLNERVQRIKKAKTMGLNSVVIPPYKEAVDSVLGRSNNHKWAHFLKEKLIFPPPYLYFMDDPWSSASDFHYAEFYGIDTIIAGNRKVVRLGLR
jgi:hypothetical protein